MTTAEWAIRAEGVSKKFGLTLRQSMKYGLRDVGRRLFGRSSQSGDLREGEFWAVNDASFTLNRGEALGIMGVNGCGKTTLLRILNGVYAPDRGKVEIRGRVGALIAAGAGFAPLLTGRENVYVNGALLGLTTREIDGLMDEIVAFSELEQFIDLPVKNYSSGMYVRLGFAIAALSRPDVLLMDEVLAVGDLNFQKKCYEYILKLKREGTAIILVSHSPGAIWSVCDRGLFMNRGKVMMDGSVEDAIRAYDDQNARNAVTAGAQFAEAVARHEGKETENLPAEYGHSRGGTGDVSCDVVEIRSLADGRPVQELGFGEGFRIAARITVLKPQKDLLLRFTVDAVHYRFIVVLDSYEQGTVFEEVNSGVYDLFVDVPKTNLRPGAYKINLGVTVRTLGVHLFYWFNAKNFVVLNPTDRFFYADNNAVMQIDGCFALNARKDEAPSEAFFGASKSEENMFPGEP